MSGPFWLSHHHPDELDRCYPMGTVHVCARCLGTYPTLAFALFMQARFHASLAEPFDVPLVLALTAPALVDWAYGRFRPHAGHNLWRTATGVLLGAALGRSLFVHVQRPWPWALVLQLAVCAVVAAGVWAALRFRPPR